jgi:hypothetical protein
MLRLKREPHDDEIRNDEALPEPSDSIIGEDEFSEVGIAGDDADGATDAFLPPVPGPVIAAATFVPTFLAIFFGLSYLLGGGVPTVGTAGPSAPSTTARATWDPDSQASPSPFEALRDPFAAPPPLDVPAPSAPAARPNDPPRDPRNEQREPARPSDPREPSRGWSVEDSTRPAIEASGPTLPPAQPRAAIPPSSPPRATRPAEAPRQPRAAVLTTSPEVPRTAEARGSGRDWTPAAAFADREAAGRLASSIQQQGYPVEIRQDRGATRPWVVWIGAQPRGGERRR